MELNWLQSLVMGLFSGLTDLLPVSSQAHQTLLLTFFGGDSLYPLTRLTIHGATLITLLICCRGQLGRIRRQLRLARLPKRRRTRTPDLASLMDAKIIRSAMWPMALWLLLYRPVGRFCGGLLWLAVFSLANAVLLYLPRMFPTADKDSRLVTPGESWLMGLGAGAAALPGISPVGASYSVGILHGIDRGYMIHLSLMMQMVWLFGMMIHDALDLLALGAIAVDAAALLSYGAAAGAAVVGTLIGNRVLRRVGRRSGLTGFSYYSFGVAVFTFILYLMV